MPFFHFRQNNSFGRWVGPQNVIVEADDHEEANRRAANAGVYFDGCDDGRDCSCCGDRWSRAWRGEKGDQVPSIYGEPYEEGTERRSLFLNEVEEVVIVRKVAS